ncbi:MULTISPECIES: helix-turn-helix domain-containing protein [Xanthomonas]|uniref:helix-turn-helix domain-containing protein n=1 Tax=Xanthomonas TaxID=338 RepID=UPI001ADC52A3|nr:helix-turn-helix domain-containing protein [Xanthomonas phaseoli]MBO9766490.1 helix-turn-helix domain-containing protein [Xanthomonas phaseoli pv. dieffenbachiae]MBO9776165.1 helix-turn-helix domain-containing protein [Xanthomonas phaseoli pv. dieffenbachiae]MBO9778236.1 helix-turn-helix domain-containing protein [Xanthomonas phaseoli pv. dieffenbachiae]MBO9795375.1 helix-turn-helix domain-containing protein [Xanthomonas phaseoli pv. dieffenbachiae]MBO9801430.1 helix-turn-helix domain-conta
MSTLIMSQCWPMQMPPTPKAVLISLADNANDQGHCWPSIPTIAERTCFSERAVQSAIRWLEGNGVLTTDRSNGRHTRYWLTPGSFTGTSAREAHYVYRITHLPTGRFYVGSRTCACAPEADVYFGSGAHSAWLASEKDSCKREILAEYATRLEANRAETQLLENVVGNKLCLNQRVTNPANAGGNHSTSLAPQEMHPAGDAPLPPQEMRKPPQHVHQPPQHVHQPPQEMPSNRKEPTRNSSEASASASPKTRMQTFDSWNASLGDEDAIRADDPVFAWADKAAIPEEFIELAWLSFADRYSGDAKRYADWRAVFRNAVRGNWQKIWFLHPATGYTLTTIGEQYRRVRDAEAQAGKVAA